MAGSSQGRGCGRAVAAAGPVATTVLFDSSVLIAHLRGDTRARDLLRDRVRAGRAYASVISRAELEGGMRSAERSDVARLFEALVLLPVTDAIARQAGSDLRQYRSSHHGVDLADYLIGATADEHHLELATLNVCHFPAFPNLRPPW